MAGRKFAIAVHKDKGSDYGATVLDLPGCFSAGSTLDEALENSKEAILCHIEGLLRDRKPIPPRHPLVVHQANPALADAQLFEVDMDGIIAASQAEVITDADREWALDRLKVSWMCAEGSKLNQSTVEQADAFSKYIFSLGEIEVPHISASNDGEINFYWKIDGFTLDLGFTGNGTYSYYAQFPNGEEFTEDAASFDAPLPERIIGFITQAGRK